MFAAYSENKVNKYRKINKYFTWPTITA